MTLVKQPQNPVKFCENCGTFRKPDPEDCCLSCHSSLDGYDAREAYEQTTETENIWRNRKRATERKRDHGLDTKDARELGMSFGLSHLD